VAHDQAAEVAHDRAAEVAHDQAAEVEIEQAAGLGTAAVRPAVNTGEPAPARRRRG
jgi:hypothetical protein